MKNLLLIDDDKELVSFLEKFLTSAGFKTEVAFDGEEGLSKILSKDYNLILLDIKMPRMDGFEVLRLLRQKNDTPVLMLTIENSEQDILLALEMGADDYISKPFSEQELLKHVQAVLRYTEHKTGNTDDKISYQDIELFPTQQQITCQGFTIELTSTELLLLEKFLTHPGDLLTRSDLSEQILGKKLIPSDRSIDMHLSNLRRKIPIRLDGQLRVKNVRGQGYVWLGEQEAIKKSS
ncbi:response regulator [Psychromonas sp. SP041]|uniref:response regulator n=1 Tax=Psychromonas sp. SP041 TaxID=1365007 RepID=UPI0003F52365|nr:response regulator [Psychromonas sp. SP041]